MTHQINWIEFATPNPSATRDFFSKVFGWNFRDSPMPAMMTDYYIYDAAPGPMGAVHGYMQDQKPRTTIYLYAPDIDATLAEVQAAGGKIVTPKMFIGDAVGTIAHFADPNGNVFGLWDRATFEQR
jgi:uncharacterized protein